jgi:predicted dehydrogenase
MFEDQLDRRDFFRRTSGITAGAAFAGNTAVRAAQTKTSGRVIGANDRIQMGLIGRGSRATFHAAAFTKYGQDHNACQLVAVADVCEKRKRALAGKYNVKGFLDYRQVIAMKDVDAVVIAIPDHWHAQAALDAMHAGKDVYVEKPMCHTNEEVRQLVNTVRETAESCK